MAKNEETSGAKTRGGTSFGTNKFTVIGIGGASRSGKSTLARRLAEALRSTTDAECVLIHQDSFFKPVKPAAILDSGLAPLQVSNWESPEAMDFEAFRAAIVQAISTLSLGRKFVIIEGFLLYFDSTIVRLLDIGLFLSIDRETCYARRLAANSLWAHPEPYFEPYFDDLIWPQYVRSSQTLLTHEGALPSPHCPATPPPLTPPISPALADFHIIDAVRNTTDTVFNESLRVVRRHSPLEPNGPARAGLASALALGPLSGPRFLFVLGPTCSGKGTLLAKLSALHLVASVSVGDLLRTEVQSGGPRSAEIQQSIQSGTLVSTEISLGLLRRKIQDLGTLGTKLVVIDGYPSSVERMHAFHGQVGVAWALVHLACPSEVSLQRTKLRGRADDTMELFEAKLRIYREEMGPVVERYRQLLRVIDVDASMAADDVYQAVVARVAPVAK